jgi:hypothetical protein
MHEKGGKLHTLPCHHNLDRYLEEYKTVAGIGQDAKGSLSTPCGPLRSHPHRQRSVAAEEAYRMIQRRATPQA